MTSIKDYIKPPTPLKDLLGFGTSAYYDRCEDKYHMYIKPTHGDRLTCKGCPSPCCKRDFYDGIKVTIDFVRWALLRFPQMKMKDFEHIKGDPKRRLYMKFGKKECWFLGANGCVCYTNRPLLCRYYPIKIHQKWNKEHQCMEYEGIEIKEDCFWVRYMKPTLERNFGSLWFKKDDFATQKEWENAFLKALYIFKIPFRKIYDSKGNCKVRLGYAKDLR